MRQFAALIMFFSLLIGCTTSRQSSGEQSIAPTVNPSATLIPTINEQSTTTEGQVSTAESGVAYPEDPSQLGLAPYPDEPIETIPTQPVPVAYVIEHRTALDTKEITVQGIVVATLLGEKACPPDMGLCAQPSLFLADSADSNRDPLYDLRILVSENEVEGDYPLGERIEVRIVVSGTNVAVVAMKVY